MRRKYSFVIAVILFLFTLETGFVCTGFAAEKNDNWNISGEIRRLYKEAPSISAYPDARGVVWLNSFQYNLASDGTMEKTHRFLMLMGQHRPGDETTHVIPIPQDEGASLVVTEAAWYNPMTGMKEGTLPVKKSDESGFARMTIEFPREAEGRVVAVSTYETHPQKSYLDDALFLADAYPIWEQSITVDIPDGMDLYWQGVGVREPIRRKSVGRETTTWTLMNQPVWQDAGIVDTRRPYLVFSLRKGTTTYLRALQEAAGKFQAPPMPSDLEISDRNNLIKTGESIATYMTKKSLTVPGLAPQQMKTRSIVPTNGPWTPWEQTLIAGKWMESMGYPVEIYWRQLLPTPEDGPSASDIWAEPVLLFRTQNGSSGKGREIFFEAGQATEFGKTAPSLCGTTVFRVNVGNVEKFNIPAGNAAEHILNQSWKLTLDEKGIATGSLEITVNGAWVDTLAYGRLPTPDNLVEAISRRFIFNTPGLTLSSPSVKQLNSGYRIIFAARSALGIVSGNDILMRVPSVVPQCLEEVSSAGEKYSLRFPFMLEQSVNIATPRGYRIVGALPAEKQGDSKALLEESMNHWPKRGLLEATGKWTVRVQNIDETLSKVLLGQLNSYIRWSQTTLPLRKR